MSKKKIPNIWGFLHDPSVISQKIPAKIKKVRDKHNSLCYVHNV